MPDTPKVEKVGGPDTTIGQSGGDLGDQCALKPEVQKQKIGTTEPLWGWIPILGPALRKRLVKDDVVSKSVDKPQGPQ